MRLKEEYVKGNPDVSRLCDLIVVNIKKILWENFEENDEFDFEHVEFVRMAGSLNANIEEAVGNATVEAQERGEN